MSDMARRAHPKRIMFVVCVAMFMAAMDATVLIVAVPQLGESLTKSEQSLQWILDAYLLVFASLILICGSLGDRFGRRRMLLSGLVVFGVAAGGAALTPSVLPLIIMRILMGLGGAMMFPTTLSIIAHTYTNPKRRSTAIAIWTAMYGVAIVAGPLISGVLLTHFWWGSIFLINVPIVIMLIILGIRWLPKTEELLHTRLDFVGAVLSVLASGVLVASIIEAPSQGWSSPIILAGFAAGVVFAACFVLWELHSDHPMLHMSFFRLRAFSSASFTVAVAFFALMGISFVGMQYLQFLRGYSPIMAGVSILPLAFAVVAISGPANLLAHRIGPKVVSGAGLVALGGGAWIFSTVTAVSPYWIVGAALFLIGLGLGLVQTPATDLILLSIPKEHTGVGSAMNDMTRNMGSSFGIAVAGSVMAVVYHGQVTSALQAVQAPAAAIKAASKSIMGAQVVEHAARMQQGNGTAHYVHRAADQAFLSGFGHAMFAVVTVVAIGLIVVLVALPNKMPDDNQTRPDFAKDLDAEAEEREDAAEAADPSTKTVSEIEV